MKLNIENGIVLNDEIEGVPFKRSIIPKSNKTSRSGYPMKAESTTVHNTGNSKKDADARMHTKYVDETKEYVSWHFTVDDHQIFQELPVNEVAWHAGDGKNGEGNRTSIGVEICETGDYEKAEENAIMLIRSLNESLGINLVIPHQHWTGKNCPHLILKNGWDEFSKRIEKNVVPEWKLKGLKALYDQGIISDYDRWKKQIDEPLPAWAVFEVMSKISK